MSKDLISVLGSIIPQQILIFLGLLSEWWCKDLTNEMTITGEKCFSKIKIPRNSPKDIKDMKNYFFESTKSG